MTYPQDDDFDADDPGNVLRRALSEMPPLEVSGRALAELLYTAAERGLFIDFEIDEQTALTIWKIVELAKVVDDDALRGMRM